MPMAISDMESYDLMSSDHFHVVLHPNREHGMLFNRLDSKTTMINYDDAKELSNLKLVARTYGIVGRFLEKYLVLIKSCTKVGNLFEPNTRTEHSVYVIDQVQIIDILNLGPREQNVPTNASNRSSSNNASSVHYDISSENNSQEMREIRETDEFSSLPITISTNSYNSRANQWNPFKFANSLKPRISTLRTSLADTLSSQTPGRPSSGSISNCEDTTQSACAPQIDSQQHIVDDADKRLAEEMIKLFNNTHSFYFSPTLDLTNRFSKKFSPKQIRKKGNEPLWETADKRFFWNMYMLKDLIELSKSDPDANYFICVILHGFVSIEQRSSFLTPTQTESSYDISRIFVSDGPDDDSVEVGKLAIESTNWSPMTISDVGKSNLNCDSETSEESFSKIANITINENDKQMYHMALISRRSVYQAGTRYRRRGCDESGNCANFVETEQIFRYKQHFTSMIIIRGSIPLFWYQTGYNYRPPPVLHRSDEENYRVFEQHFLNLFQDYDTRKVVVVDCTEHTGREKILHDAFRTNMDKLRQTYPHCALIEFDFHRFCRGRQNTDAHIEHHLRVCGLTEELLKKMQYYWNDNKIVLNHDGYFRVNCLDCSDRTNVVQRNIALQMLDLQLARLGIIDPDTRLERNVYRRVMHTMWTANGNVLSTQYCGTRALFGGDGKKLTGYLKDTYSSASRYYMSKFRDVYRQAAIDAMLGIESVETENLKNGNVRDQYELLNFDPILASGRQGGALLRDMGNRVGTRLARLRGRLGHVRPFGQFESSILGTDAMSRIRQRPSSSATTYVIEDDDDTINTGSMAITRRRFYDDNEMVETGLIDTLGEMSIDWPTSESMENLHLHTAPNAVDKTDDDKDATGKPSSDSKQDIFARFSDMDDCFQDDEFSHVIEEHQSLDIQRGSKTNKET